jgi:hypothetical protein
LEVFLLAESVLSCFALKFLEQPRTFGSFALESFEEMASQLGTRAQVSIE